LHYAAYRGSDQMIKLLLQKGADPGLQNSRGRTPLHIALMEQHNSAAEKLIPHISRDAMNISEDSGSTPLHYACLIAEDSAEMITTLISSGAQVEARNRRNLKQSSLHTAVGNHACRDRHIPLLLAHGALTELEDAEGNTPLHIAVVNQKVHAAAALLEAGADVEAVNQEGSRSLSLAVKSGNVQMVKLLLLHGARVTSASLLFAMGKGCDDGILHHLADSPMRDLDTIELILGYGTDVNAEDDTGSTPLHEAAKAGNALMIKKLLEHGAAMHWQNHAGNMPLDLAQQGRHREAVECL
ncbi:ankyrin, partial [Setomelanomma holmii]